MPSGSEILEHEPGDLTCIVEAGVRLSDLQDVLSVHRQRFSLDPPGDPTLGECLLDNLSGPLSHRFGTMRDLVIGVSVVLPDGLRASSGGKVVKNVAGYDLGKLFCGSHGRLGAVERLALRLHPLPAAARTAVVDGERWLELHRSHARAERRRPRRREVARPLRGERAGGRRPGVRTRRRGGRSLGRPPRAAGASPGPRALGRPAGAARPPGPARRIHVGRPGARVEPAGRAGQGGVLQRELIADCVHCGFCLPTCPTYGLWHEEMDSPRGRIYLMSALVEGTLPLSDTVVEHFDRCLGCMACVSSCPSGVQYDRLIEQTRAHIEEHHRRGARDRFLRALIFAVFPHRRRLRAALAFRRLPAPGPFAPFAAIAPPWVATEWPPERTPGHGARVALVAGCVQSVVFGDVNTATARVLAADGYDVHVPRSQGCCGALAIHAGRHEDGLARARDLIPQLEDYELVVSNAAGCGSNLKDYAHLLADDPGWAERAAAFSAKVRDVSELLADPLVARAERKPLELRVAFQDSCHLRHAQRVASEPRAALAQIPGLTLLEPAEQEICCGSAGIYNLVEPDAAGTLGDRKAGHVLAVEPDAYASGNPGCLVQVTAALRRAGRPLPAFHPVELVDASIRGLDPRQLLEEARR